MAEDRTHGPGDRGELGLGLDLGPEAAQGAARSGAARGGLFVRSHWVVTSQAAQRGSGPLGGRERAAAAGS